MRISDWSSDVCSSDLRSGYIDSVRGRGGGIRLGKPPADINIGALVRHTEEGFNLVDCGNCALAPACGMTGVLKEALGAFLAEIGGASCRERVGQYVEYRGVAGSLKKKKKKNIA